MLDLLGLVGSLLFGIAVVPMAWKSIQNGNSDGIPDSAMWLFWTACVTYYTWLFLAFGFHLPFVIGIVETGCWSTVIYYRYFPRRSECLM